MKKYLSYVLIFIYALNITSCATLVNGPVSSYQKTKPKAGEPRRKIKVIPFIVDCLFYGFPLIIDFSTGAIYKDKKKVSTQDKSKTSHTETVKPNPYTGPNSDIIGNPIDLGNILIAEFDFPDDLTYVQAKQKQFNDWRLPTKQEHQNIICPNKSKIPNLIHNKNYWSGTEGERYRIGNSNTMGYNVFYKLMYTNCDNGSYLNITDNDKNKLRVRLVKSK
jgi:hypothetical protein